MDRNDSTSQQRPRATLHLPQTALPVAVADELEAMPDLAKQLLQAMALYAVNRRMRYEPDVFLRWLGIGRRVLMRVENLLRDRGLIRIESRTRWERIVVVPWLAAGSGEWQ